MNANEVVAETLKRLSTNSLDPAGFSYLSEISQLKLDFTESSLDQLDKLLQHIRRSNSLDQPSFISKQSNLNFVLLLSFYIGTVIAKHCNYSVRWYQRVEALEFSSDSVVPQVPDYSLIASIGRILIAPLVSVEDGLFGKCDTSIRDFFNMVCPHLEPRVDADENVQCQKYLAFFHSQFPIPGGLTFEKELRIAGLDYSLASLNRIDELLQIVKQTKLPTIEHLPSEFRNFMLLVSYYMAVTVARIAQTSLLWIDFAELRSRHPTGKFTLEFVNRSVCVIDGRTHFTLWVVKELLFNEVPPHSVASYARKIFEAKPKKYVPLMSSVANSRIPDINVDWQTALEKSGFLAAMVMSMLANDEIFSPTVLMPKSDGTYMLMDYGLLSSPATAFKAAQDALIINQSKAPFLISACAGYAQLSSGRFDAVIVELCCYSGGIFSSRKKLTLKIVCPYVNKSFEHPFAIHDALVAESSCEDAIIPAMGRYFRKGVESVKHQNLAGGSFSWNDYVVD